LGQLRNQCALCSQVAVLVETRIAPVLSELDEARDQRDSLQAAATRLEAQRVELETRLEEEKKCRDDLMEGLAEARAAQRPRVELTEAEMNVVLDRWNHNYDRQPGETSTHQLMRQIEEARQAKEAAAKQGG
jgi:chromosome segregation ATPase